MLCGFRHRISRVCPPVPFRGVACGPVGSRCLGDGAGSSVNASEQVVLVVCRGPSAGCVEGGAVGGRGRVVGGPFAQGRGDV